MQTVLGPKNVDELGLILAHEHLFTDLRTPDAPGQGEGDPDDVVRVMGPYLDEAWQAGTTALIECTPPGVGQNARVMEALARNTQVALVMPTGLYRQQWIPQDKLEMSDADLTQWMVDEITGTASGTGIQGTGVKAGFIKMGVSDGEITRDESRNLRAAARAAIETGVLIASHTSGPLAGQHAMQELDILDSEGLECEQFNWVHAQAADVMVHQRAAERGAYIGFDGLHPNQEDHYVGLVLDALTAGLEEHVLLSHDAGWYRPGEPDGGASQVRGFTYLIEGFLPRLREEGVSEALITQMTETNPKRAFRVRKG
jgi:phosphotriesterase-related protein